MVKKIKLNIPLNMYTVYIKHTVQHDVYENVLDELNVGHCWIKVKVTNSICELDYLIFQITSRYFYIVDSGKSYGELYYYLYSQVCCGRSSSVG